jgi:hypothetical protein
MKKHFIALVKMEGSHEGKIGQHSTDQQDKQAAINWAKGRFNRPFTIIEMNDGRDSLEINEATEIYNNSELHEPRN